MTSLADVEYWERPLRYNYCRVHDLLCGFPKFLPPGSGLKFHILFVMAAFTI